MFAEGGLGPVSRPSHPAAERVEQERQAELAQTGNMLNLQIQGSAVERAAEAGSPSERPSLTNPTPWIGPT